MKITKHARWSAALSAGKPVLADFFTTWCPPCRQAGPFVDELSKKYPGISFVKVNAEESRDLAAENGIRAFPTFKLFDSSGELVRTVTGFKPAQIEQLAGSCKTDAQVAAPSPEQESSPCDDGETLDGKEKTL